VKELALAIIGYITLSLILLIVLIGTLFSFINYLKWLF
jgi:hypothetical protein